MSIADIKKRVVNIRVPLELAQLVERQFAGSGDSSKGAAYIRALESVAGDERLHAEDMRAISEEMARNMQRNRKSRQRYLDRAKASSSKL